jgi:two-component system CheB/CheR fusion protein
MRVRLVDLAENAPLEIGFHIAFRDVTTFRQLEEALKHSNQELETAYEEIQSTNEELETTNEELQTANEELRQRGDELNQVNGFFESILRVCPRAS